MTSKLNDAGNSNPDADFRFDSSVGTSGGYIFWSKNYRPSHGHVPIGVHGGRGSICLHSAIRGASI